MSKILLLNGPNLNLLGTREPEIYGTTTLAEIEKKLSSSAIDAGHEFLSKQTNAEHEMINFIQRVCMVNDLNVLPNEIIELSWKFSGDTNNGKKENIQQTWKKLLSELNHLSTLNTMDRTTKP